MNHDRDQGRGSYARARIFWFALLATMAIAVSAASGAVTSSNVTSPANGSYFQGNADNPSDPAHQVTFSGTTVGGNSSDSVDLLCTFADSDGTPDDQLIEGGVPLTASGTFSIKIPAFPANQPCVVRAVPAGGGLPDDQTPFTGPRMASGEFDTATEPSGLNQGLTYDYDDDVPQFSGQGNYFSVSNGGLFDAHPVDPLTLAEGADLVLGAGYLSDVNTDRSDVEVDGIPAYASAEANFLFTGAPDFSGLPALSFSSTQDSATGDVVVHESELLVKCEPIPATYPATSTSCTSFASTGIRFDRTIVQDQGGRQAHFTDTYTSVDGKAHTVNLRYGQDFSSKNAGFNFPWVDGTAYKAYPPPAADTKPAPPSAPASVFLKFDNSLPDGDESSAQGAITFAQAPTGFSFLPSGLIPNNGFVHLYAAFARDVPAGGSATLKTTYSWAFTQADTQALANLAAQSYTPPGAVTGAASATTTTGATVSASVNANAQPTTYQFQYGTTTAYGSASAVAGAGTGTTPITVSSALTRLRPDTTYHYRVVATNGSGTTTGADQTFNTVNVPTRLTVGKVKVKGQTAAIPLSCTGNPGKLCNVTVTETVRVHGRAKTVGHAHFAIQAGVAKTVKVKLNRAGRHALARASSHRLHAKLTVHLGGKRVALRTVTFKHPPKHRHKHKK
jgi:hypothetical protein